MRFASSHRMPCKTAIITFILTLFSAFQGVAHIVYVEVPRQTVHANHILLNSDTQALLQQATDAAIRRLQQTACAPKEELEKIDLLIVYTVNGEPLLPDLKNAQQALRQGKETAGNELSFTFNSPDYPWSPLDLDSLQALINLFYPIARSVYGEPAFNITINIKKNPNISSHALYNPSRNEMTIKIPEGGAIENYRDAIVHEMIHAFHDDLIIGLSGSFEEGMTRAAEVAVFNRSGYHHWDKHHQYTYDVYYEGLNKPAIASKDGNFYGGINPFLRYQLAGYAWAKLIIEDPTFFASFNQQYYLQAIQEPFVRSSESRLKDIVRALKPQVEGLPYDIWYDRQHIFNTNPAVGYQLFTRTNQYTVDYFLRNSFGGETGIANTEIDWEIVDCHDQYLDGGSGLTTNMGLIHFGPDIPAGYAGRLKIVVSVDTPQGAMVDVSYRDSNKDIYGDGYGIFGIVQGGNSGHLKITPADSALSITSEPLTNGQFMFPAYKEVSGTFTLTSDNANGQVIEKVITKDASSYFVHLKPNKPPKAEANGPYKGLTGTPLTFDASGSSDPDGDSLVFIWDFGDGSAAEGKVASHTYTISGSYPIILTATDIHGSSHADTSSAMIGFHTFGLENDDGGDVFGDDWCKRTIFPYLERAVQVEGKIRIHFKARITRVKTHSYDLFGVFVYVNGIGGFYGTQNLWQPTKVEGAEYRWYSLTLPTDLNGDGFVDWTTGPNIVSITNWSGYNEQLPGETGVDVIALHSAPVADAGGPYSGQNGEPLLFDGSASSACFDDDLSFIWDFGDSVIMTSAMAEHVYAKPGMYHVILTVNDGVETHADTTEALIGFRSFGSEDDDCLDVCGDDWADRTIYPFLPSAPQAHELFQIHFRARITEKKISDYDYAGQFVYVNDIGGFHGDLNTWQPVRITDSTFHWYVFSLPADVNKDGTIDWLEGTNILRIVNWSGYNNINPGRTGVDVIHFTRPPVAYSGGPYYGFKDRPLELDASDSYDADGDSMYFTWDFSDGGSASGINATHTFSDTGRFLVILTVNDDRRGEDADTTSATIQIMTGVHDEKLPTPFAVGQNYPNPFNSATTFCYQLPQPLRVEIMVYNISGKRVRRLEEAFQPPGRYTIVWNGADDQGRPVASGVYILRVRAGAFAAQKKVLLMR
ncbi:PKD domain-containing protein [candidate division KSB1 bacterium]|nr:PKD domain-containing protein [candidate division KSB1 bacterium]